MNFPDNETQILPFEQYEPEGKHKDCDCLGITFDPLNDDERINRFWNEPKKCKPYFEIIDNQGNNYFFEIPYKLAYWAKAHRGFTKRGDEQRAKRAVDDFKKQVINLFNS